MLFLFILLLFAAELFPALIVIILVKEFRCILSIVMVRNFFEKEDELFDLGRLRLCGLDVEDVVGLRKFVLDIIRNYVFKI